MTKNILRPTEIADNASGVGAVWGAPEEQSEVLVALTTDQGLLALLRRLASPQELRAVPRETDFGRALLASPAALAIIDCSALTRFPIEQVTRLLMRQFPQLHLVVVGTARDQEALAPQIAAGQIHHFLQKPVTAARLRPVIDAVLQPQAAGYGEPVAAQRRASRAWLVTAVVVIALTGGAVALRTLFMSPEPPAQAPAAAAENPLEDLLARADTALAGGGYDNAIELYRKAQQIAPGDQRITEGLSRVAHRLVQAAQLQLFDQHLDEAQALARQASTIAPDTPQLRQLMAQIAAAQEHPATAPAAPAAAAGAAAAAAANPGDTHPRGLEERLREAQELMRQGHLLDPPQANARSLIRLARDMAPGDPRVGQAQRELLSLVLAEARRTLATGRSEDAERLIAAANDLGARPDEIDALQHQAFRDRAAARNDAVDHVALLFNERLQQGRLLEPATDSAKYYLGQLMSRDPSGPATQIARRALGTQLLAEAVGAVRRKDFPAASHLIEEARAAGADAASIAPIEADLAAAQAPPAQPAAANSSPEGTSAVTLLKIHDAHPVFPKGALRRLISGRVELGYTVRADGTTDDFTVISAQPPGTFDQAAIEAVRQWRYRPPLLPNGKPIQVKTSAIIRFAP